MLSAAAFIILAGFTLHYLVTPKLIVVSAGGSHEHVLGELPRLRRQTLALAFPVLAAWLFMFALRALAPAVLGAEALTGIFIGLVGISAFGGYALARGLPSA